MNRSDRYLTLPYLTIGVGRLLHLPSAEAVSRYRLGTMRNLDVTAGHISLLVVLANRIREIG